MLILKQYDDKIWAIIGDTRAEVALSFMRFQEYYENPIYKGVKGFTVQQIVDWQKTVNTTPYEQCWAGFNIPGTIINEVLWDNTANICHFEPFTEEEQVLIGLICSKFTEEQIADLYFIGAGKDEPTFDDILMHEVAHGLFKTNLRYRNEQLHNLNNLPNEIRTVIRQILLWRGYSSTVMDDETHAYLLTDCDALSSGKPHIDFYAHAIPFVNTYNKFIHNPSQESEKVGWISRMVYRLAGFLL